MEINQDEPIPGTNQAQAAPGTQVGQGVTRLQHLIVNSYVISEPGAQTWAIVDAGLGPGCAGSIIASAEAQFGPDSVPSAIILTHGHFDHIGGLKKLLKMWDVPVFAHELELPYLTGRSAYPPPDPTVGGGMMARLSRFFPSGGSNFGEKIQALPQDGAIPGLPGWCWVHTPGHSPGHVSLFRLRDRMLLAGDAFVTVKQESLISILRQRPHVTRPPAYFTPDWVAAKRSLEALARLEPAFAATGHGPALSGATLREQLRELILDFDRHSVPAYGRYVRRPVVADETGVALLPPPVPDPFPKIVGVGIAALVVVAYAGLRRSRRIDPGLRAARP